MGDSRFENDIRALVANNQKIMAVKLYRERTGLGLADAKSAVEAIAAGASIGHALTPVSHNANPQMGSSAERSRDELAARAVSMVNAGRKIEAIKFVREETGMGLAEAKAFVESLQSNSAIPAPSPTPVAAGSLDAELLGLIHAGRKIDAIKRHREATRSGLADAKDYVEALEARGIASSQVAYAAPAYSSSAQPSAGVSADFKFSTANTQGGLAAAPMPATMSTLHVAPNAGSSPYVPRERRNFSDSPTTTQSDNNAVAWFLFVVFAVATVGAAAVYFLALR